MEVEVEHQLEDRLEYRPRDQWEWRVWMGRMGWMVMGLVGDGKQVCCLLWIFLTLAGLVVLLSRYLHQV